MKDKRTHYLNVIRTFSKHAERSLSGKRKRFWKNVIKSFSLCKPFLKNSSLLRKFLCGKTFCPGFFFIYCRKQRTKFFYITVILRTEYSRQNLIYYHNKLNIKIFLRIVK